MTRSQPPGATRPGIRKILSTLMVVTILGTGCGDTGTGTSADLHPPIAAIVPNQLSFGDVLAGQSATMSFTVTNVGGGLLVGTFQRAGCTEPPPVYGPCWYLVGTASYELGPQQSKIFEARFAPFTTLGATCGLGRATCQFVCEHGSVRCSGTGVLPPPSGARHG